MKSGRHLQPFREIPENGMDLPFDVLSDPHFGQALPDFTFPPNITTLKQSLQISRAIPISLRHPAGLMFRSRYRSGTTTPHPAPGRGPGWYPAPTASGAMQGR
jgi:hypothetical protein